MVGELEKRLVQGLLKRLPKLSFADDLARSEQKRRLIWP